MESVRKGETVIPTPKWFIGIRVAQIVFALVIVALAGYFIHGAYYSSLGVAIAAGIFTWIVAAYAILTEHSAGCRPGYNTWAILSLDFFLIVLWLASLGANAQFATSFDTVVQTQCYNDGSAINSNHCVITRRGYVAGPVGLAALKAVAGLSALMLIFFVATLAYVAHFFRLEWAKHSSSDVEKNSGAGYAAPAAVPGGEPQPFVNQQQQPQQYQQPQYQQQQQQQQPQWSQQQQHQPNNSYPSPSPAYDPYTPPQQQQNTAYTGAQGVYNNQPAPSELHSAQSTPAPNQPYYPPH